MLQPLMTGSPVLLLLAAAGTVAVLVWLWAGADHIYTWWRSR